MVEPTKLIRRSIYELQRDYDNGNKKPLSDVVKAFQKIQALHYDDPNSFFRLAGYHGEPFVGKGKTDSRWWGGYCQHGNILFPTWHRAHLLALEKAFKFVMGYPVAMPYFDYTSDDYKKYGLPWALVQDTILLDDGTKPQNPLKSYTLPIDIVDELPIDEFNDHNWSKRQGYVTKRYPYAGLDGPEDREASAQHNSKYTPEQALVALKQNMDDWLNPESEYGVYALIENALNLENYTLFSNRTASGSKNQSTITAIEVAHDHIHLALGGFFDIGPTQPTPDTNFDKEACGDMGENDTASFDPIFYFHHCNIDRLFWIWQKLHNATERLGEIDYSLPGTVVDGKIIQPTVGQEMDQKFDLDTPLTPFEKGQDSKGDPIYYTSNDLVNIANLGYDFTDGSWSDYKLKPKLKAVASPGKRLAVSDVNRAKISGSFVIRASVKLPDGTLQYVGHRGVLSRWRTVTCKNCQNTLKVGATFRLPLGLENGEPRVDILTHGPAAHTTLAAVLFQNVVDEMKVEILD